ncbi:hypothetical protein [Streptomyces sp. CB02009]|nr:hypothetical protein [Streptomyces sp. CB02009]
MDDHGEVVVRPVEGSDFAEVADGHHERVHGQPNFPNRPRAGACVRADW